MTGTAVITSARGAKTAPPIAAVPGSTEGWWRLRVCTVQLSSVQEGIYILGKAYMRSTLSSLSFPSIFLYACESWTLTAELQRRVQAMETRCYRKILHISNKDHVTNQEVRAKIQQAIGPHEDLLTILKRRKLRWYDHVSRSSGVAKTILQGTV